MADFSPNLDDGELYLPADIFINERIPNKFDPHDHGLEDLARHFNALSLLQQTHHKPKPKPRPPLNVSHDLEFQLERFKPPFRNSTVKKPLLPPAYFGVNGGLEPDQRLHEYGTGSFPNPGLDFQFLKPIPSQVESYLLARTSRVLQRQQNRLLQQNQNRLLRGGFGFNGGLVRESGGTGVFHPRVINSTSASDNAKKKQQQSVRNKREIQVTQHRDSIKRVSVSKQEDCYYHLPPDMGLPRDWTY